MSIETALPTAPRIARPFSLVQESKDALQAFFDARYDDLKSRNPTVAREALSDLAELIGGQKTADAQGRVTYDHTGVFPPDILKEMEKVFNGVSDYVVIVQNCPEMPIAKDAKAQETPAQTNEYYANYIGRALRLVCNAEEHCYSGYMTRSSHKHSGKTAELVGTSVHRDMITRQDSRSLSDSPQRDPKAHYTEVLLLSCPQNDEHAPTRILNIKQALQSISDIISDDAINKTFSECVSAEDMAALKDTLRPYAENEVQLDDELKTFFSPENIRDNIPVYVRHMDDTIQEQYLNAGKNLKPSLEKEISYKRKKVMELPQLMAAINAPLPPGNKTKGIIDGLLITNPPGDDGKISRTINKVIDALVAKINDRMMEHSLMIDFQPGTIAVLDEGRMFHLAYQGEESAIKAIDEDQSTSRQLLHLSMNKKSSSHSLLA